MTKFTTRFLSATALVLGLFLMSTSDAQAQNNRPASPRGSAETQIDGKWITVDYGRPILRGRRGIFAQGDSYGATVLAGAPVWRLGANQSTQLTTEAMLHFGNHMIPSGTYTLFAELNEKGWTLIISTHEAKAQYGDDSPGLWGAYGYTADKDVARIPMTMSKSAMSVDEFTIGFADVTSKGGKLVVSWDDTIATASFMVM